MWSPAQQVSLRDQLRQLIESPANAQAQASPTWDIHRNDCERQA